MSDDDKKVGLTGRVHIGAPALGIVQKPEEQKPEETKSGDDKAAEESKTDKDQN